MDNPLNGKTPKRKNIPEVIRGIVSTTFRVVPVDELADLKIDSSYQRGRVTTLVWDLEYVLQNGGSIPDPLHIVERRDGTRWIVDGQQKYWAFLSVGRPCNAMIYRVKDYETERQLFVVLNNFVRVGAGFIIQAHNGPGGKIICDADSTKEHPLFELVSFGVKGEGKYGSAAILDGLCEVAGTSPGGNTTKKLQTIDRLLATGSVRARCDAYLVEYANVFPKNACRVQAMAFGRTALARWGNTPREIPQVAVTRLRGINWKEIAPSLNGKWMPQIEAAVSKAWR